jgi:hypothetical protein
MSKYTSILSLGCLLLAGAAYAQGYYAPMKAASGAASTVIKLPAEVKVEFKLDFPKANDVYWEREYGNTYTASFIDTTVINVTYDSTGYRQYTEWEITPKQLPAAVTRDINSRYPGWEIKSARVIKDSKNIGRYNALVQKDDMKNSYEVNYDMKYGFICSSPPLPKIAQ